MAETNLRKELDAIEKVTNALEPLDQKSRDLVIEFVFRKLGIQASGTGSPAPPHIPQVPPTPATIQQPQVQDIRTFKKQKNPRNNLEMAALVAFYLQHLAPQDEKQATIGKREIEQYFNQANFPLPGRSNQTLIDAKKAGYLDFVKRGRYKLNPVGHNLIAHSLPAGSERPSSTRPPRSKRRKRRKKR